MKINKFEICDFKGIQKTVISLCDTTPGNVTTLIGLNESGKTTILEAISRFVTEDKDTATLVGTVQQKSSVNDLIPKSQKAAFTGKSYIKAFVYIEDEDLFELSEFFRQTHHLVLNTNDLDRSFTVERAYEFEDSTHKNTRNFYSITFQLKSLKAKRFSEYTSSPTIPENRTVWLSAVNFLNEKMSKIVYFPTFLFDFPDRIYLQNDSSETNSYYVQVIQDILDSVDESLSVKKHIIDRIDRLKEEHPSIPTFLSYLFGSDEKTQIDAVLQKIENRMSEVVFTAWNQILGRNISGKRIKIGWMLDIDKSNAPYLEISIVDGQSTYKLSERSLGFRWFFSFLLFTQFRKNRKNGGATIFLFDEPAANLHSKAQIKLLDSFSRIAKGATHIVYSTHSHYMVNPLWLEKAYIVENSANDYESDEEFSSFVVNKTNINAVKYKTFVGANPVKTTYFQPVLDALEVNFSPLERSSNAIIIEGKFDYHPFVYFRNKIGTHREVDAFPGNGAGDSTALIKLFRGWGVNFKVILDDDRAGRQAKNKYLDELLLRNDEVFTLKDIHDDFSGKEFDNIYQEDLISLVRDYFQIEKPTKRHYSLYFQYLLYNKIDISMKKTQEVFQIFVQWINQQFPKE